MISAYIALGSNLGDRRANLCAALAHLEKLPASRLAAVAGFYETDPVGMPPGSGQFINGAAAVDTDLTPEELLAHLQRIERQLGRAPAGGDPPQPRTIDLDLLLYGGRVQATPGLRLPHPRMHLRRFVLEPLAEIAPDAVHPATGLTVRQLLASLDAESGA